MFGFKKKDKEKKKGKKGKPDIEKVSSTLIYVRVFSPMGGDLRVLKASYKATEQRNNFGELVSLNDKFNHDQDVNFYMDSIYREMQVLLDFRSKSPEQKKEILDKRIKKQEKLIFFLNKVPELNAFYNYQDEWAKLRDLRILRNYLRIDEHGSYFYIENGIRTYEFDAIDGFLIPRWHGNDTYSSYPDHTRTKKIKLQEDLIFEKEMQGKRFDVKLMSYASIFFVVNMVLIALLGFEQYYTWEKLQTVDDEAVASAKACMDNAEKLNTQYSGVVKDTFDFRKRMLQQGVSLENTAKGNGLIEKSIK